MKMKVSISYLLAALTIGMTLSGCGKSGKSKSAAGDGQLHGVSIGGKHTIPKPPGMVYVPAGTFHMGPSDEDISYAFTSRNKQISINGLDGCYRNHQQ
jgi:formylglycine-generating enzyme required for sulfatase activity